MADNKNSITIFTAAKDFIQHADKPASAKAARMINLLEKFGRELNIPHSKKITKDIYELRIRGKQEIRILYAFSEGKILLLHGFIKKTDKIPQKEIKIASARFGDLTE